MNAKKIMGAVLVALLAAALFVGAGAAAPQSHTANNGDTVFFYENITLNGAFVPLWSTADGKSTISAVQSGAGYYFIPPQNYVDGIYYSQPNGNGNYFAIKAPTAQVLGISGDKNVLGGSTTNDKVDIYANVPANVNVASVAVTYPNGTVFVTTNPSFPLPLTNLPAGDYKVVVKLNTDDFAAYVTPEDYEVLPTYTFSIVDTTKVAVSTNVESVIDGGALSMTITGPAGNYNVVLTKLEFVSAGEATVQSIASDKQSFTVVKKSGDATIYLKANADGEGKIKVTGPVGLTTEKEVTTTVKITKGTITAKTDKESYFIGNDIVLTGTSTAGEKVYFYIEGTNMPFDDLFAAVEDVVSEKWELEINNAFKTGYDAGTYTVYISNKPVEDTAGNVDRDVLKDVTYTTAALILKQPFISVTDAPTVAVKNTDYIVKGTAEAASEVYVYIFGTNFFAAGKDNINAGTTKVGEVTVEDDAFTIEIAVPDAREKMAAGQYFMVIQHPMYNEKFNIAPNGYKIVLNETASAENGAGKVLFEVNLRQTANAAQALCDALDTQNIDDLYVKLSFVVAAGEGTINPIPAEITKGSKLTVSGSTNVGEGKVVTVEMLSTAFAAVPKDTVGSASFIALTTTTDADGNWEVTFDTSSLNVDEYTVSVAVESLDTKTAKINVIEGAPTEQPTENPTEQPTQTQQPTEAPTTPGFGALAALAGLGAVAVLLLRRE